MSTKAKPRNFIVLRAPPDLVEQAKIKARSLHLPLSHIMRELLRAWLADQPEKGGAT